MATTKASVSRQPAPDGLTRSQVARQLGIGITAVHHMRLRGELRPTPPVRESACPGLLDEDPRAEEEFARAMAQAAELAFSPLHKPKKLGPP